MNLWRNYLSKTKLAVFLAAIFACLSPAGLGGEDFRLVTYYPFPFASYKTLFVASETVLASSGGRLGIGTTSPQMLLDVNGKIRMNYTGLNDHGRMLVTKSYADLRKPTNFNVAWASLGACSSPAASVISCNTACTNYCRTPQTVTGQSVIYEAGILVDIAATYAVCNCL